MLEKGTKAPEFTLFDKDGNAVAKQSGVLNLATLEKGIAMITE